MKPSTLGLFVASAALLGIAARQAPIPSTLARDFDRLSAASTVRVDVKIREIGEAPVEYQIALAKPNLYRVEGPDGFVLSDGNVVYTYNKAKNTYYETPAGPGDIAALLKKPEVFGWAPFFEKEAATTVVAARAGSLRTIEGSPATEVEVTMKQIGVHGTLFIDQKLGVARGYDMNIGGKEYLALASQIVVGADAATATEYAFVAPNGAKKTEAPKPDDATYTNVQTILTNSCMPCHSTASRSGGVDLTNYRAVSATVTPGNGAASRLVTVLRQPGPGRMPQGRAPLTETQITQIQKWIDQGAKNN